MYIPKDINRRLKEEAKRSGRTNIDGMVVAPVWSKLFLQADYVIAKQADEIERLREALADIANIVNPYEDGETMQEIAREALKEKE